MKLFEGHQGWGRTLLVYLGVSAIGHFLWEMAQLPLYTLFWEASTAEIAFAVVHCTLGDVLIAGLSALAAYVVLGANRLRRDSYARVSILAVLLGVAYTVFSEWQNVEVWRSWTYTAAMPRVPPLGTGLSPLLQWIAMPSIAFIAASRGTGKAY